MVAYYNEIDEKAAAWLRELIARGLIADGVVDTRSIEDVEPRQLAGFTQCHFFAGIGVWSYALRRAGWPDDRPVWTMSCPCQPFSAAGKGGGFDDERHLWPSAQWLIQQRRPELIIGEQVASKDAEPWLDLVQTDVEALGYAFGACAFPSAGVGAPHIRDRTYWVADNQIGRRRKERAHLGRQLAGDGAQRNATGFEHGRSSGGLADDDDDARLEGRRQPGRERGNEFAAGPGGLAGGLANSDGRQRDGQPELRGVERDGQDAGRPEGGGELGPRRVDSGVADTNGARHLPGALGGIHSGEGSAGPRHGEPERQGAGGRLADTTVVGRIGRGAGQEGGSPGSIERSDGLRDVGRLAGHAGSDGAGAQGEHGLREVATHAGPVNGGWGNADWIYCRNGEWWPVERGTFPLSNGASRRVVAVCAYCQTETRWLDGPSEQTDAAEILQTLRRKNGAEAPTKRQAGGAAFVQSEGVLQSAVLRVFLRESPFHERGSAHESAPSLPPGFMRALRVARETSGSPPGSESVQQCTGKSGSSMLTMSSSGAPETEANVYLRGVRETILSRLSPEPVQDMFCAVCEGVRAHQCEQEVVSRVVELRGYGNAINAEAATLFIKSYLEAHG